MRPEELPEFLLLFGGKVLSQRIGGGAGNVQREHAFDPHPLYVDQRLFVLAEVSFPQAVVVHVPDAQLAQLLPRGDAVVGRVESELDGAGSVHCRVQPFKNRSALPRITFSSSGRPSGDSNSLNKALSQGK